MSPLSEVEPEELPQLPTDDLILVSLLGEGGMARVYRAWMVEPGQWCAVKVLRSNATPRARKRFLKESEVLCTLSHRNVVKGYTVGRGDPAWFVMEIADGGSLKDWCARFGRMPPRLAVDVAIQICKGVAVAHAAGYVHRDIKPHNVLVNRRGFCKVTDFGVARIRSTPAPDDEDPSNGGDSLGTLGYMAPEQQSDPTNVDQRCDVYGIGATLFHLLSGGTPPGNLFMAAREYPEIFQGMPDVLVPILQKATAYKRTDRHDSVMDLARELHATWDQLPVDQRGPTLTTDIPPEPPPPPGMSSRTPNSAPTADSVPNSLSPRALRTTEEGTRPPTLVDSTPSAMQMRLALTAQNTAEPEPERTRWWLVAVLSATLLFAVGCLDILWVNSARWRTFEANLVFAEAARKNVPVIDELAALGADRRSLEAGYERLRDGSANDRLAGANAWVTAVKDAARAHGGDERERMVIQSRITELESPLGPWTEALGVWERRSRTFPGSLVTVTGIVGTPDTVEGRGR